MSAQAKPRPPRAPKKRTPPPVTPIDELPAAAAVELGGGLELRFVHVDVLLEQDVNARTMTPDMFQRLQETVGRDQRLESLPFCAETAKGVEIVSGHHRVRAARAAQVSTIPVIVDVTGLTPSQIKAKQLAHNAIAGYDDPDALARLLRRRTLDKNGRWTDPGTCSSLWP